MSGPEMTGTGPGEPSPGTSHNWRTFARRAFAAVCDGLVRASQLRTRVARIIAGVTTVGVLAAVAVFLARDPLVTSIQGERIHDTFGKIVVESPEVYTRERLVNDRLRHAVWLRKQMRATEDVLTKGVFRSHEAQWAQQATLDMSLQATNRAQTPQPAKRAVPSVEEGAVVSESADETNDDVTPANPPAANPAEPGTSMELFRAMAEYREQVRTELMQTQLDDRHDIDGNTLYRLNFNTTVIHGRSSDALAVIRVELEHGDSLEEAGERFYRALLRDWSEELERRLNDAAESRMRLLIEEAAQDLDDSEFYIWLRWKICRKLAKIAADSKGVASLNPGGKPERNGTRGRNANLRLESPESISVVQLFHGYHCGERYYHDAKLAKNRETQSESQTSHLDNVIRNYVDRFRIGKRAQDWFLNYAAVRPELLDEIKLRMKETKDAAIAVHRNPVDLIRYLEFRWCQDLVYQPEVLETPTDNRATEYARGKPASFSQAGSRKVATAQATSAQPVTPTRQMREKRIVRQHCTRVKRQQNEPSKNSPMFAVINLYWHLEHLENQILKHDKNSNDLQPDTKFDEIGCGSTIRDTVDSVLMEGRPIQGEGTAGPEWVETNPRLRREKKAINSFFDFENGLFCMIEPQPWLWLRNLAVEQQVEQFNREFLDSDLEQSGGTGILEGVIRVETVGCEAALCRVSVKPNLKQPRSSDEEARSEDDPLECFFLNLDQDYEAFSYGVTPKNWRQRLAFSGGVARNLAVSLETPALIGTEVKGLFDRVRREEEALRSVINHPIVIGFGKGRMKSRAVRTGGGPKTRCRPGISETDGGESRLSRGTEFGWIVAPEMKWG